MAKKTFHIDSFQKGYFMSWFVTTQAAFLVKAKLYDSSKVYFEAQKQSVNIEPPLSTGYGTIMGNSLCLDIDEPQSANLDSSINTYNITTDTGAIVGYGYNICIEDQNDRDYNDVSISLVAWKHRG
ncbi:conserved hypothetical protein [Chloroherpeton thalassium ATCC 35110]|uniref:Uncharacterized protein n=1 Tax=Chloroherpeton thalassium (strain ATCC 35110 / GB-78) TaxID=517418 RepID=B3QVT0_CHLT3|nr:hypothetical protein [Chloroherpeton thalassium]ACF13137.1 conserved hypothetical protein [Chloroherpeton thalassium ATCC 35110]